MPSVPAVIQSNIVGVYNNNMDITNIHTTAGPTPAINQLSKYHQFAANQQSNNKIKIEQINKNNALLNLQNSYTNVSLDETGQATIQDARFESPGLSSQRAMGRDGYGEEKQ